MTMRQRCCGPATDTPRFEPFGPTSRQRQIAAAAVVMAGAVPVAMIAASSTTARPKLYLMVLAIGIIGTFAWLIDGRRYLGAGLGALGLGTALTLVRETTVDPYFLIFGLVGLALLIVSKVNPLATPGVAGLLIYTALASRGVSHGGDSLLPRPLTFALVMIVWGGSQLRRTLRTTDESAPEPAVVDVMSRS